MPTPDTNLPRIWDGGKYIDGPPTPGSSNPGNVTQQQLIDTLAGYVPQVPTRGAYSYDSSGRVTSDPDGNTYTYNADDTIATITKGTATRTFAYNSNGIASVA